MKDTYLKSTKSCKTFYLINQTYSLWMWNLDINIIKYLIRFLCFQIQNGRKEIYIDYIYHLQRSLCEYYWFNYINKSAEHDFFPAILLKICLRPSKIIINDTYSWHFCLGTEHSSFKSCDMLLSITFPEFLTNDLNKVSWQWRIIPRFLMLMKQPSCKHSCWNCYIPNNCRSFQFLVHMLGQWCIQILLALESTQLTY